MNSALAIWVNGSHAADLSLQGHSEFCLSYTESWRQAAQAYPFSPHLPLATISSGAEVKNFFANLLPEGSALDVAASSHNLSKHDAFGLLAKIGREAAGAMMILPAGQTPQLEEVLRPLPLTELAERIRQRPYLPFSVWDGKIRLSIAGYQDKLAVHLDPAGQMSLPDGSAASTHIIKPDSSNPQFSHLAANEYFCMCLARACKLNVPLCALRHIPQALFQIERFDRKRLASGQTPSVLRLHQLDLCQILNLPVEMKYQQAYEFSPQGACYLDLFRAADSSSAPLPTKMALLRWVVFNYLIGNTDAHAKNVSFLLDHSGLRLAPFYDLLCGTVYGLQNLALFIGKEEEIALVSATDWLALAQENVLAPALLAKELQTQAQTWFKVMAGLLQDTAYLPEERLFLQKVSADIGNRAQLMQQQAALLMVK